MKTFFLLLAATLAFVSVDSAYARGSGGNWLLGMDLSYISSKTETETGGLKSTSESTNTLYDLSFGGMLGANLYVGAMYSTKNDKSLSTSTNGSATGVSIGYVFDSGVHLTGTYFLTATDENYKKGSGYEIDLGWRSFISSSFFVGAKLAMRSLKYTENATILGFQSVTSTTTLPYISFGFGF